MNQTTVSSYRELVERFPASRDYLIPILQELQDAEGYIPEAGDDEISR